MTLTDEFRPFLYPNQYTWFTADSKNGEKKPGELANGAGSALDVITEVYDFTIQNIVYDEDKAKDAESGKARRLSSGCGPYAGFQKRASASTTPLS